MGPIPSTHRVWSNPTRECHLALKSKMLLLLLENRFSKPLFLYFYLSLVWFFKHESVCLKRKFFRLIKS